MRKRKKHEKMSEINVTPLVDIMLVLLIIFMVTAPLLSSNIPIDLPKANGESLKSDEKFLDINIDASGNIYIASEIIETKNLVTKVVNVTKENPEINIMISADRKTSYGNVIEIMGMLKDAGLTKIGLKTDANIPVPKK